MADFAPNRTPRIKVQYRVQSVNHTFTVRTARGVLVADIGPYIDKLTAFLAALAPQLYSDWVLVATSFANEDSDIFLPCISPASPDATGDVAGRLVDVKANFIEYVGRGAGGSKVSFYIYGTNFKEDSAIGADYRITNPEHAAISGSVGVLTETGQPLYAIDATAATWYSYVNLKANDHYVHRIRNGG